eukprot:tig00021435_g21395.t1
MAASSSSRDAQKRFELENSIDTVDPDAIFKYNADEQKAIIAGKPWTKDPHYFKNVKISALALLKMVMHARSGGTIEVMGVMQGKVDGSTIIVLDSFALPVEGTETRVNAQAEAYEYMVQYKELNEKVGRLENVVGWYHSHPGYGCWLSGIDVTTQMSNQQYQEPFLAVVIDPTRTISAGKTIPLSKIEDFGVHCKQYYPLEISYFKSSLDTHLLDLLWNKYWINTLSSSPILANREYTAGQIADLAEKLEQAENQLSHGSRMGYYMPEGRKKGTSATDDSPLTKITRDASKIAVEQCHGLMSQVIKDVLFNQKK